MKRTLIVFSALTLWAFAVVIAQQPQQGQTQGKIWTRDQGQWMPVPVFPEGATMKVMQGNPNSGPSNLYVRFPAGYGVPFHFHTPNEHVYMDRGTLELQMWKSEHKQTITSGGYFFAPSKMIHNAKCVSSEDCFFYLNSDDTFDINIVNDQGKVIKSSNQQ